MHRARDLFTYAVCRHATQTGMCPRVGGEIHPAIGQPPQFLPADDGVGCLRAAEPLADRVDAVDRTLVLKSLDVATDAREGPGLLLSGLDREAAQRSLDLGELC